MMSVTYEYDLVCIGSGPAGQRAAVQAAKLGKRVAVVERHLRAGGVSIETGTIPSKSFREAVCGFGYRRGDGRRLRPSMKQLLERVDDVVGREVDVVHDQLRRNDVELIHGHASFVGRRSRPGSNPTESPFSCPTTSSSWSSCPRSMVVVGAGVIGIEYASMFAALGVQVTVVDKRPRPLQRRQQASIRAARCSGGAARQPRRLGLCGPIR